MEDKFSAILNDPDKMKMAFEMAQKIMGQNAPSSAPPPPEMNTSDLASMLQKMRESGALDSLMSNMGSTQSSAPAPEAQASEAPKPGFADMLPNLLQMMGGGGSVNSDRANLLKAIKPYVNENRAGNIERAVNVAGMAKNAKSIFKGFKR